MKKIILILLIGSILSSYGESIAPKKIWGTKNYVDSLPVSYTIQEISKMDSIIDIAENSFRNLELNLVDISEDEFNNYVNSYISNNLNDCGFDKLNLNEETDCDEICETYLSEINSNKKLYLPCDYDAGILGASFSQNCNKLIVCSSYDGPDFDDYYENRAEFYLFKLVGTGGLNSLQAFLKFATKEWSIEDYVWINDNEIGLKLYSDHRWGDGSQLEYQYFRAYIPK